MYRMTRQDRLNWAGVAILSIVLHALLFAYHAAAPGNLALKSAGLSGEILICSGGQAQAAWLGYDGERGDPASDQVAVECPVCSAATACAALPDIGEIAAISPAPQLYILPQPSQPYRNRPAYSHSARAPPLIG